MRNRLPLTVSEGLWNDMADTVNIEFADSYLSGAKQGLKHLTTHTVTGYERMKANRWAMKVLSEHGLALLKPLPFGHPDRPDTDQRLLDRPAIDKRLK
jgi:hypothetical protein